MRLLPLLSLLLLAACSRSADPSPSLIEQADRRLGTPTPAVEVQQDDDLVPPITRSDRERARRELQHRQRYRYTKREGLLIDLPYLGGRKLAELDGTVVADQLGTLRAREELPRDEERLEFDKATVWLYEGRIYRIRRSLPHPMDKSTALGVSGYPLDIGVGIDATAELRWNNAFGARRLRLLRNSGQRDLFDTIEQWKFLPSEERR